MKAGQLRRRFTLQEQQRTADDAGGYVVQWVDVVTVWGDLQPSKGREVFAQGQVRGDVMWIITLRYRTGVHNDMRAVCGTRVFNIRSVVDTDARHRQLVLVCEELQASGT